MKRALVVVALAAASCRSAETRSSGAPPAASLAAPIVASAPLDTGLADAARAMAPATPAGRALPRAEQLATPFRGARAHGFVAMTNREQRVSAALTPGEALDLEKPVLLASFTKLFTAVAALRMVERNELSLDETVREALPELAARPWASSTIRELLTHTSLVPEFDEKDGYYRKVDVDFTAPAAVLAQHLPRDWVEKRGVYKYRNAELALVGAILARRSKVAAPALLAREVFEPAGMKHAGLLVTKPPADLDLRPMGAIRPQNFFTAGAGYASAGDLLSFFEGLAGTALLTPASKAVLFEGAAARGHGALGCWAYPFPLPDGGTTQLVERPGSFGNVRLFAAFFPEEGRAVVAYTNDGVDIGRPRSGRGIGVALARAALE